MIRNNQNGRRRGRGGARPPQAGGGPSGNYGNSGGNRMDVRQRGNATQLLEKYKALARDATQGGDRVQAEYFMQYADHYYRVLNEFRARDPQPAPRGYDEEDGDQPYNGQGGGQSYPAPQNYAPANADGRYADEIDDEDAEDEAPRRQAAPVQNGNDRQDRVRGGQDQQRQRSPAYARDDQGSNGQRDNGQRDNSHRDSAPRDGDQRDNGQRDFAAREQQSRDGGQQRDQVRYARNDRPARDDRNADGRNGDGRNDRPARDERNGEVRANGDGRAERRPQRSEPRREEVETAIEPLIMTIPGLPGPATVASPAPVPLPVEAVPVQPALVEAGAEATAPAVEAGAGAGAGAEAPVPRRRGRPRKVVVTADESAGDA